MSSPWLKLTSMDEFYRKAQADGVQLVVGPLEKPLVKQLSTRPPCRSTTLALNYSEGPLFQFGLAAEDEAQCRAALMLMACTAAIMVPKIEWGGRIMRAFSQDWQALAPSLPPSVLISRCRWPADRRHVQLHVKAKRAPNLQTLPATSPHSFASSGHRVHLPRRPRRNKAQQIKPTASTLVMFRFTPPRVYSASVTNQYNDMANGIRFLRYWTATHCVSKWFAVQAAGNLGRLYAMGVDAIAWHHPSGSAQGIAGQRIDGESGGPSDPARCVGCCRRQRSGAAGYPR